MRKLDARERAVLVAICEHKDLLTEDVNGFLVRDAGAHYDMI